MRREFIVNIALLIIINVIIKPIYIFGVEARVQDLVGTESYGLYFSLFNFVFLFQFINDPGLQTWNAQFVPKNRDIIGQHLGDLSFAKLILSLFFFVAALGMAYILGFDEIKLLVIITINLILSSVFMLMRSSIAGLGFYKTDSLLSALDKLLMILLIGFMVWLSPLQEDFTVEMFVLAQMFALAIAVFIVGVVLVTKSQKIIFLWSWASFKHILKSTAPYVMTMIFMTAYNKLDGVMLGQLIDDNNYQAGVYASAYRFYDAANMLGYLFAALLLPMFAANMYNFSILKELQSLGLRYASIVSICLVWGSVFYGEDILPLLYSEYQPDFFNTLKWLIFGYLAMAIGYIYGTLLVATGKIKYVNVVYAFGLVFNVLLNVILIPKHGAKGAAIATLITQIVVLVGQILVVKKELFMTTEKNDIIKLTVFFALSYGVFYMLKSIFNTHWLISSLISVFICLLLPLVLRLIRFREVQLLLNKKNS